MTDLVAFLRARLDEDEAGARGASPDDGKGATWTARQSPRYAPQSTRHYVTDGYGSGVVSDVDPPHAPDRAGVAAHIARHDPARVLAEVAAKRTIVDLAETADDRDVSSDTWHMMQRVLGALAGAYAAHPDYQPEWAC